MLTLVTKLHWLIVVVSIGRAPENRQGCRGQFVPSHFESR